MIATIKQARTSMRAKKQASHRSMIEPLENRQLMASTAEVTTANGSYVVTVDGAQTYTGGSYTAALGNAAGIGDRIINVRVGGTISQQIRLRANTTFNYFPTSTRIVANTGSSPGIYAYKSSGIVLNGLRIGGSPAYGIRLSSCASPRITNLDMDFGSNSTTVVGLRVDSDGSTRTSGLYARNVRIANLQTGDRQGFETYGIDNYDISGVTAYNLGGCGLLINDGQNGTIGTVSGDRCGNGTGYATMRFANNCVNATVQSVTSTNAGRGLFILNSTGITVNSVNISSSVQDSIWIQNGSNNKVLGGTVNDSTANRPVITSSSGSSIRVTFNGTAITVVG